MNRKIALIVFTLVLGGCERKTANQAAGAASGEVLPGSVSDAMLDTDQSRAKAPLAVVRPVVSASGRAAEVQSSVDGAQSAESTLIASDASASKPVTASSASAQPKPKPLAR
jgi:hypothetical protein